MVLANVAPQLGGASKGVLAPVVIRNGALAAVWLLLPLTLVRFPHLAFARYRRQLYAGGVIAAAGYGVMGWAELTATAGAAPWWLGFAGGATGSVLVVILFLWVVRPP